MKINNKELGRFISSEIGEEEFICNCAAALEIYGKTREPLRVINYEFWDDIVDAADEFILDKDLADYVGFDDDELEDIVYDEYARLTK